MAPPPVEKPVFADTSLGTHMATSVPPGITVGDLKRKLEQEHSICFPNLGKIKTNALMVKRKNYSYHLPDSMPVKYAFQGLRGAWFLCMDTFLLEDMHKQKTSMPSTIQHHTGQVSFDGGETLKLAPHTLPASENLTSLNHWQQHQDKSREAMSSVSDDSDVIDCKEEHRITFTETHIKYKAGKKGTDQFICNEEQRQVRSVLSKRRQRRLIGSGNIENDADGTSKDIKMERHVSNKHVQVLETVADLDSVEEKQTKDSAIMGESLVNDLNGKGLLSEYSSESSKHRNSLLLTETPCGSSSGKISITDIISRYFSEFDEVNSCGSSLAESQRDTINLEALGETHRVDDKGCTTETAEFSVSQGNHKMINRLDLNKVYSLNMTGSDEEQFGNNLKDKNKIKPNEREMTDFVWEGKASGLCKKRQNTTSCEITDEHWVCKGEHIKSYKKNATGLRKLASDMPPFSAKSTSGMFTLSSSLDAHMEASKSKLGRNDVGKRLLIAANNVGMSTKRSPISMFISRCGKLSTPDAPSLVRNIVFDISESDD